MHVRYTRLILQLMYDSTWHKSCHKSTVPPCLSGGRLQLQLSPLAWPAVTHHGGTSTTATPFRLVLQALKTSKPAAALSRSSQVPLEAQAPTTSCKQVRHTCFISVNQESQVLHQSRLLLITCSVMAVRPGHAREELRVAHFCT